MAELILAETASVGTPGAGTVSVFADNTPTPNLLLMDDTGTSFVQQDLRAVASTVNQTGFASDTYLAGTFVLNKKAPKAGTIFHCCFDMVKTAAGTATPIIIVRYGTLGTTSDAARLTFTFGAGTAAIDTGIVEIWATFRTVGSGTSAVLQGFCKIHHHLAATGLTNTGASGTGIILVTSGGFDSTVANSGIGVSFNGGASFSGTNTFKTATSYNF